MELQSKKPKKKDVSDFAGKASKPKDKSDFAGKSKVLKKITKDVSDFAGKSKGPRKDVSDFAGKASKPKDKSDFAGKPSKPKDKSDFAGKNKAPKTAVKTTKTSSPSTFGAAFKAARKKQGAGGTFTYKGKKFSTNRADDAKKTKKVVKKKKSSDFLKSVKSAATQSKFKKSGSFKRGMTT